MTTNTETRAARDAAMAAACAQLAAAEAALRDAAANLPELPAGGRCSCGAESAWRIHEPGLLRTVTLELGTSALTRSLSRTWLAIGDGWDDIGDEGAAEWVQCDPVHGGCGAEYGMPDDVEWV